ncbi:MAG: acyl-ACP--UDP-N-acetylglucosamine O-acyltransferase [Verrucomicrobiae bacterium]|nr:acyl-ACP--UDP-N-acetylglucosamine O-acyltransferase [Verrucomicrobiae bacterium]
MKAHPTALIDPAAGIADDVEIGPYTIIESGVRIDAGCRIGSHVHLLGSVEIGAGTTVGPGAIIGADPQSVGFDPAVKSGVVIGKDNVIREYVTIHRGLKDGANTRIGDHNFLMTGAHLGHDVILGNHTVIANNCLLAGHVIVGNRCFLGGGSVYHQFMRIGDFVMAQGLAALGLDIPPFVIAAGTNRIAGINVTGLKRANLDRDVRAGIKGAFDLFYCRGLNLSQALEEAGKREWRGEAAQFVDFFRQETHRGFCLQSRRGARNEE